MKKWPNHLREMSKLLSRKHLYEFLAGQYATIASGAEVLSVGAGGEVNRLLQEFADRIGFRVVTLDIDDAKKPDLVGDICLYDFGKTQFDVVVMSEVLEHLHSPHLGLANVHALLRPNGRLILSTPFILPIHDSPHDYFRFTRHGLEFLLKEFREVSVRERNSYFEAIDVLWVRLLQTESRAARLISHAIIPLVYYIKRPITWLAGKLVRTDAATTGYVASCIK